MKCRLFAEVDDVTIERAELDPSPDDTRKTSARARSLAVAAVGMMLAAVSCGDRGPARADGEAQTGQAQTAQAVAARFACGDLDVRARFEGDRAVLAVGERTLVLPQTRSASGARYAEGTTLFWNKGREATLALDGSEYACREVRDPWRDAEARGIVFRAVGQEPGWYAEIDGQGSLLLVYDYGARRIETMLARTGEPGGPIVYRSTGPPEVVLTVVEQACSDVMSGQPFPSSVTVTIAAASASGSEGPELRGCGRATGGGSQSSVSAAGFGAVRIGMTAVEAQAALGMPFEPLRDQGECVYRRSPAVPGILFMQIEGQVVRVDVTSYAVRTDRGVGVGDSEAFVREAYGDAITTSPHKYVSGGNYLTVAAGDNRIVFETDGMWVTRYRVGRLPEVEWVEGCA